MNRRDSLLALLALGAAPRAVEAQQPAMLARIAYLSSGRPDDAAFIVEAFKQGLRELGYIEGKNAVFEFRWALYEAERLPGLAKELVALKPNVILASNMVAARAAQQATTTIPIVVASGDPIASGLVKSLARPGGNITGVSNLLVDTSAKLFEMLLAVLPKLATVAILWNPSNPVGAAGLKNLRSAAQTLKVNILPFEAQTPAELENAFARMSRENVKGFVVVADPLFFQRRHQIAELASKHRIASMLVFREQVEAGGLMSYGANLGEGFRRAATYVDKILKGAKPGDLPIEQAMTLELVINIKTAKALGIAIPRELLLRADRVIE